MYGGLPQLRLPELALADVMALGEAMTPQALSRKEKHLLRLPWVGRRSKSGTRVVMDVLVKVGTMDDLWTVEERAEGGQAASR